MSRLALIQMNWLYFQKTSKDLKVRFERFFGMPCNLTEFDLVGIWESLHSKFDYLEQELDQHELEQL